MTRHHAHKAKQALKKPSIRLALFVLIIVVSALIVESLKAGKMLLVTLPVVIQKGIEVLTDVMADRFFPEV